MYLGDDFGQPTQVDTAGAIVTQFPAAAPPAITTVAAPGANWLPWLIAAGLALAVLWLLSQPRKE